jgi:transposase
VKDVDMPRRRRSFTPEHRVKAAHLVIDAHRRVAEVARELDMGTSLLHTWVRDERWRMSKVRGADARMLDTPGGQPVSAQQLAELLRLRATVTQQAKEIAFLKEVLGTLCGRSIEAELSRAQRCGVRLLRRAPESGDDNAASVAPETQVKTPNRETPSGHHAPDQTGRVAIETGIARPAIRWARQWLTEASLSGYTIQRLLLYQ